MLVAVDPGFGATKVKSEYGQAEIMSTVARMTDIGQAGIGMKQASKPKVIQYNGVAYVAGDGAWAWGSPLQSMDYEALFSSERLPLLWRAISDILPAKNVFAALQLVVGLPVPLLQNTQQAQLVFAQLKALKREHVFSVDGHDYRVSIDKIKTVAQPVGAYALWAINDDGKYRADARAEVAVLDIGMNTLDGYVISNGEVMPRFVGGDEKGVRRLIELLDTSGDFDTIELDARLRKGRLAVSEEALATYQGEVLALVKKMWPRLGRFATVIVAGGGIKVLGDAFAAALVARGATVTGNSDPVMANVLGLYRWGLKHAV